LAGNQKIKTQSDIMLLKIKSFFAIILVAVLFTACTKESSYEGAPPNVVSSTGVAVFTFSGSPNVCSGVVIGGTYAPGVPVNNSDSAIITLYVDSIGSYAISTNTVNGVSFNGSGNFTRTGSQTITLYASGRPGAIGNFTFVLGTNGCSFTIPVAVPGSNVDTTTKTAAFTFAGAPNACTTPIVAGSYQQGILLNSSNTVSLSVIVDTIGSYIISSAAADGVLFSASGTFTSTGPKVITLTGSGTPVATGTFTFSMPNNGCSFPITVTSPPPPPTSANYFYSGNFGGTNYSQTVTSSNGYQMAYTNNSLGDSYTFETSIMPASQPFPANFTVFNLSKGVFTNFSASTQATFKAYFAPGNYSYAQKSTVTLQDGDGVVIQWGNNLTDIWSTDNAPGTQTGSSFTITNVQDGPALNGYNVDVTGTFNCTLYNSTGVAKTVTGGQFKISFLDQ
jgi:hypothetical protein